MKKQKLVLAVLLSVLMVILSACGSNSTQTSAGSSSNEEKATGSNANQPIATIKAGMVCGGMTPMLAQIGIRDGSFEKAGVKVEEVCFNSGSDAISALVGGSLDVNLGSYEHVLKMTTNDLGIKAYGQLYNGVGYSLVVKKDAPYEKLEDLKGQTLAVTKPGSLSDTGLRKGLETAGINPDQDVTIIGGGSGSTMLAAIESDKVAGGMVSEPTLSQMVSTGDYRVLYDPDFEYAGIVIMSKEEWVNQNKEAMGIFAKELVAIYERAKEDPKHVVDTMQEQFKEVDPEALEMAVGNQVAKVPAGLIVSEAGAKTVNEIAVGSGLLKEEIPYEKVVDSSLFK